MIYPGNTSKMIFSNFLNKSFFCTTRFERHGKSVFSLLLQINMSSLQELLYKIVLFQWQLQLPEMWSVCADCTE